MTTGFAAGSLFERAGIPRVGSYVAVGALLSEPLLGSWIPSEPGAWTDMITKAALGVIAFFIGAEIDSDSIRRQARAVCGVVIGQSAGAFLLVTLALAGLTALAPGVFGPQIGWNAGLVLGAIAIATAPAATLAIIEEYEARGDLTTTLLGIIAIDDAIGVMVFTIALGFTGGVAIADQALAATREIGLAVAMGLVAGAALGWFGRRFHDGDLRLPMILAAILLNVGLSDYLGYADLLSNIVMGYTAMCVFARPQPQWLEPMQHIREAIFLIFFALAGTHFDPDVFAAAFPLILLFIAARSAGKYGGAYAGAAVARARGEIRRWAGLALMPQAGVAIGFSLRAIDSPGLQEVGSVLLNVIIGSTIIYELTGPWLTKLALEKAGEITSKG